MGHKVIMIDFVDWLNLREGEGFFFGPSHLHRVFIVYFMCTRFLLLLGAFNIFSHLPKEKRMIVFNTYFNGPNGIYHHDF